MILVDVNLLIYAYNPSAPQHAIAREWLERLLSGNLVVMLPWVTLWAFVRVATHARAITPPFTPSEAVAVIRELLSSPNVRVVEPGPRHLELVEQCMINGQVTGPRTTDAMLAALAIEHGTTLASTDRDFTRFPGLKWINPLTP